MFERLATVCFGLSLLALANGPVPPSPAFGPAMDPDGRTAPVALEVSPASPSAPVDRLAFGPAMDPDGRCLDAAPSA